MNIDLGFIGCSSVFQRFYDTDVRIIKFGIFPCDSDINLTLRMQNGIDTLVPLSKIAIGRCSPKSFMDNIVQILLVKSLGHAVNTFLIQGLYDTIILQI